MQTAEQIRAEARVAAAEDYKHHVAFGVSLNPYSTYGYREDWRRGFENLGPRPWEHGTAFNFQYQRGFAAREIVDVIQASEMP